MVIESKTSDKEQVKNKTVLLFSGGQDSVMFNHLLKPDVLLYIKSGNSYEKQEIKLHSKSNRFFLGMLLSALNLFPIPFYVFVSVTLSTFGLFFFNSLYTYSFVSGVVIGSFTGFYLYILYFKNHQNKSDYLIKNGNYIIGGITGLVSLVTFFKLINTFWT